MILFAMPVGRRGFVIQIVRRDEAEGGEGRGGEGRGENSLELG